MAVSFAKQCEGIIAEMVETSKALMKARAEENKAADAHKEAISRMHALAQRFHELKTALHAQVDEQVAKSA